MTELVPGDVIKLSAGSLVPADARLLEENDLHVRESALTGESLPVEKDAADLGEGTHARAGRAQQRLHGHLGAVRHRDRGRRAHGRGDRVRAHRRPAWRSANPRPSSTAASRTFGFLLIRVIMLLVLFVFVVNVAVPPAAARVAALRPRAGRRSDARAAARRDHRHAGAGRQAHGAQEGHRQAARRHRELRPHRDPVQRQDRHADAGRGHAAAHVDVRGKDDDRVLEWVYLNSFFEAGMKDPLDDAILAHPHPDIDEFTKLDEIPFDFERRRLSVVVARGDERTLITKGAAEDLFDVCTQRPGRRRRRRPLRRRAARDSPSSRTSSSAATATAFSASRRAVWTPGPTTSASDERDLTLVGFAAFLDPPKEGVAETLEALADDGVRVLIMTGDNEHVTRKTALDVGLPADNIIVGTQIDSMDNAALAYQAEHGAMFARVSPEQKNRVITALKARGWVVGFLGDGINDAPSLHAADVGISVVNGVDVAQDAANIILLEKDLAVLDDGIREGRRSFANIMKYIVMGTSSNFGNMFSMAGASLFLPFLPMLPTQILLNNLLYDISQMTIPTDRVDAETDAPAQALEDRLHPPVHAHHRADQLGLRLPHLRRAAVRVPRRPSSSSTPAGSSSRWRRRRSSSS